MPRPSFSKRPPQRSLEKDYREAENDHWPSHPGGQARRSPLQKGDAAEGNETSEQFQLVGRQHTVRAPSGNGRCSSFAISHGAVIQASISSGSVRITGIALG